MNSRSIKWDSINVIEWNEIIVGSKLKGFNIQTGIFQNNNNIENEFNVKYGIIHKDYSNNAKK